MSEHGRPVTSDRGAAVVADDADRRFDPEVRAMEDARRSRAERHFDGEYGVFQSNSTDGSHSDSAGIAWTMASDTSIAMKNGALPIATSLNGRCLAMPWMT